MKMKYAKKSLAAVAAAAMAVVGLAEMRSEAQREHPGLGQGNAARERTIPDQAVGPERPKGKIFKNRTQRGIKDQYIVVFDDTVAGGRGDNSNAELLADQLIATYGGRILHKYKDAINGFAARMTEAQADAMSEDTLVDYVEQDSQADISTTQYSATWGLDRVDQRPLPLNATYNYTYNGYGVNVYVLDTGIRTSHTQFGGRARVAADFLGGTGQDCHGHGTHVAGTIGGATTGVAKGANLWAMRVLNCSGGGDASTFIAAVNWLTRYHRKPAVANASVQFPLNYSMNTAVVNSFNAGVTWAVAAGNANANACGVSPASSTAALTVGATDRYDRRASFSNWGSCVRIFAPGEAITSASYLSTTGLASMNGTSMASPHVAGAAAIYLSAYPTATSSQVRSVVLNTASTYRLSYIGTGSPNRLLYSLLQY